MLFSGKENIFKCLVAFQKMFWKIFSGIWLCSWKYYRKHIFYLSLTFSQLPNKYMISFIPQYRNTNKTQKKYHQIRSNWEKKEEREATWFDESWDRAARCWDRDRCKGEITISTVLRRSNPVQKGEGDRERRRSTARTENSATRTRWRDLTATTGVGPLHLWVVLSLSLSPFAHLWAPLFTRLSSGSDLR